MADAFVFAMGSETVREQASAMETRFGHVARMSGLALLRRCHGATNIRRTTLRRLLISGADTAWVLVSAALVLAMTVPGLALFYGGLVRSKNVLGTIMHSFVILCLVSLLWMFIGYSLAFGPDVKGVIGSLAWAGLNGVGLDAACGLWPTIPHQAFMVFQMMFAAITPALITGAFAERMKFSALLCSRGLWSLLVYCPIAHWVWGGGWLAGLGALDFAGGAVVHISSGHQRLGLCHGPGRPSGIRHGLYGAAQPADGAVGHRPLVVRVVRLQCRQRLGRE